MSKRTSLVGNLEDLSLTDILQIINVSRRTGCLQIIADQISFWLIFKMGNICDLKVEGRESRIIDILYEKGLLEPDEVKEVVESLNNPTQSTILESLVDKGLLSHILIEQAKKQDMADTIRSLLSIKNGNFAFYLSETEFQGGVFPSGPFPLEHGISPQNLLTQSSAPSSSVPQPEKREDSIHELIKEHEAVKRDIKSVSARKPEIIEGNTIKGRIGVILSDDESLYRNFLWQHLLKTIDMVERASNLQEFLSLCDTFVARGRDFISVIDLLQPTSDGRGYLGGIEILEKTKLLYPKRKVIITSDIDDSDIQQRLKVLGADAFLIKPDLSQVKISEFEDSMRVFADLVRNTINTLAPLIEEEVASFFKDLGVEQVDEGFRVKDQLSLLKGLIGELANPSESSEISLLILRLASEYFERAVLFLVKKNDIVGLGGFGETGDTEMMNQKVRQISVPFVAVPFIETAIKSKQTVIVSSFSSEDKKSFAELLGVYVPKEAIVIPLISRLKVIALLYAENGVTQTPIPDFSGMEIFMGQAGIAMEKALLEHQLKTLKKSLPATRETT